MGTQHLNYVDDTKYLGDSLSCDKLDDKDKLRYCDYCLPSRTDYYECFTSIHMKLNLYNFTAIAHLYCP